MTAAAPHRIDGIDFWRGFVLLSIFVNHAPENLFGHFTSRNYGFSDAAEAFVFLSGVSVALAYGHRFMGGQVWRAIQGMYRRALTLYGVQIAISVAGILFLVAAAFVLDSDDLTDDRDRAVIVSEPLKAFGAMLAMAHQVGFFNILPIYIVFLLATPACLALARLDGRLMLLASGALYLAARAFGLQVPTWPLQGGWFFNPFAWQFIYVVGLYVGLRLRDGGVPYNRALFIASIVIVVASLLMMTDFFHLAPGWWEGARLHVAHDKTALSWIRIVHFLALAYALYHSGVTPLLRTTWVFAPLALIGRHSLPVFATGAFLTLVGEAIMETELPPVLAHPLIIFGGIAVQYWVACLYNARAARRKSAAPAAAPAPPATSPGAANAAVG